MKSTTQRILEAYYRARAEEYDVIYSTAWWGNDLAQLRRWIASETRGRTVLELAAGTGYWTAIAAPDAAAITACDINTEVLHIAACCIDNPAVSFIAADAFNLPAAVANFDVIMAHLWWSHVPRQSQQAFLRNIASRLNPGGRLLVIDQNFLKDACLPASRWDAEGNRYEMRSVIGRSLYEIVKNYPSDSELRQSFSCLVGDLTVTRLQYFWSASFRMG
jgi:ubiquinone/menaquinone biosynthesis C-methylase UbiE